MDRDHSPVNDLNPYFFGSIVLVKSYSPHSEIVDGQRRLATLTILLAALRSIAPPKEARAITSMLYEEENLILATPNRYRIELRERDKEFFEKYIQQESGLEKLWHMTTANLSDSQRNLHDNALHVVDELQRLSEVQRTGLAR